MAVINAIKQIDCLTALSNTKDVMWWFDVHFAYCWFVALFIYGHLSIYDSILHEKCRSRLFSIKPFSSCWLLSLTSLRRDSTFVALCTCDGDVTRHAYKISYSGNSLYFTQSLPEQQFNSKLWLDTMVVTFIWTHNLLNKPSKFYHINWSTITLKQLRLSVIAHDATQSADHRYHSEHSTLFDLATGQLADTPTRGLPTRGLDISRTGQLAD